MRRVGRTRIAAKRELKGVLEPSRQVIVCQAVDGNAVAISLAETGLCSGLRRMSEGVLIVGAS